MTQQTASFDWKAWAKRALPDVLCILLFAAIALLYFSPALEGKKITGGDHSQMDGVSVEIQAYRDAHNGETPRWINSIFGGMPTYQIAPSYDSQTTLNTVEKAYHLWFPNYVWYIFASMLGFYILLRAFNFRQWMAALGAIVWAFSSYFFIIIAAGHIWKVIALAYIPPTIAGLVLCYRGKYLWGGIVTAIFAALQLAANHIQMTYYFLIPEVLMVIAFLIEAICKKKQAQFWKATGVVAVAAVIAVALNISNLYHTYEYAKHARGGSELVKADKQGDQTAGGLDRSYITNWSYGIDETMTLLIPNFRGGASQDMFYNPQEYAYHHASFEDKADPMLPPQVYAVMGEYWGEQPMTSGPVYVGALVCMLFILALFVIPHQSALKWALVAATLLSIMLSWGHNFPGFTNFFIDHVPFFSKFRPISSILVVAEFTIPLLALLGLKEFVKGCGDAERRPQMKKALIYSGAITAFICLLFVLSPSLGGNGLSSHEHSTWMSRSAWLGLNPEQAQSLEAPLFASISQMRLSMLSSDALRSFFIIVLGCAAMFWFFRKTNSKAQESQNSSTQIALLSGILLVICLVDMWSVNKRYINDTMFSTPQVQVAPDPTEADQFIQSVSGTQRNYRVCDFNHMGDNTPAFFYASIGGYHAAKLLRYQELLDAYVLSSEIGNVYVALNQASIDTMATIQAQSNFPIYDLSAANTDSLFPVLNMLNTRWFLLPAQQNQSIPVQNPAAYGNAWLVNDIIYVDNANAELETLGKVSPRLTAVVDQRFAETLGKEAVPALSPGDTIYQTELTSDRVTYKVSTKNGALAVFSEIYYPDWTATIDGKPAEMGRADYVLRAMRIPAGDHVVEMTFDPQSIHTTETIARIALILLVLAIIVALALPWIRKRRCASCVTMLAVLLLLSACNSGQKSDNNAEPNDSVQSDESNPVLTHFADSLSEAYQGHVAQFTLIADLPTDTLQGYSATLTRAVCQWANTLMAREGEVFEGDPTQLNDLFQFYATRFCQQNSASHIKQQIDMLLELAKMEHPEGVDSIQPVSVPEWEYRYWIQREYENDYFISFTGKFYGYGVENATSNASCADVTFLKSDGSILGFEMFTSMDDLRPLIEKALKEKYGKENVDIYQLGIPMPNAPLFMGEGVRFDYSDYQIIESHYFEEHGEFPSCFIPYVNLKKVLTPQAKEILHL